MLVSGLGKMKEQRIFYLIKLHERPPESIHQENSEIEHNVVDHSPRHNVVSPSPTPCVALSRTKRAIKPVDRLMY